MPVSLLPLVKQGDAAAIADLINRSLQSHGVRAKVQRRADRLHVLLEADFLPKPLTAIGFIDKGFQLLEIEPMTAVTLYGRQLGDRLPSWQHTLQLARSSDRTSDSSEHFPGSIPESIPENTPEGISDNTPDPLKHPEAVVMLIFISLMLLWDTYLALLEQAESSEVLRLQVTHLSSRQLARRLKTSRRLVRNMKRQDIFSEWTRRLDPEGMAWAYRRGVYVPETVSGRSR